MLSILYSCQIWIQLEFLGSFSKNPHIEFHKNPSSGSRDVSCGQANRDDETNRRFSQFCRRAQNQSLNFTPLRMNRRAVVELSVWSCIPFWAITGTVDGQSFGNYYLSPAFVLQAWNWGNVHCTFATDNRSLIFHFVRSSRWRLTFLLTDIFDIRIFLSIQLFCNSCFFHLRETGELDWPYSVRPRSGLLSRMLSRLYVCGNYNHVFPFNFENANNRRVEVCFMRMPKLSMSRAEALLLLYVFMAWTGTAGRE